MAGYATDNGRCVMMRLLEISAEVPSSGVNAANGVARQAAATPAANQPAGRRYCYSSRSGDPRLLSSIDLVLSCRTDSTNSQTI